MTKTKGMPLLARRIVEIKSKQSRHSLILLRKIKIKMLNGEQFLKGTTSDQESYRL